MIENAVLKLLQEGRENKESNFYGMYLMNIRRHITDKVPTAGVSVTDKVNLYINPTFWKTLDLDTQVDILKHELEHIFKGHLSRAKDLGLDQDMTKAKQFNYAADSVINEPLKTLHEFGVTYDKLAKEIPNLKKGEITEYYYEMIRDESKKRGENPDVGDPHGDHSTWNEGEDIPQELKDQTVKESLKKAADDCGGIGNCPNSIRKLINDLNKSTINWKQQLRTFFASCDKFNKESTRKRRNRRYGNLYPGKKKLPNMHIAVLNDESGSVGNAEFSQFYSEIDTIQGLYGDNLKITVIHCDTQINKVYEYRKGMDIERTGSGGTSLKPGFRKAIELEVDGLIAFTDGEIWGDDYVKTPFPTLWAIVRDKSFVPPFGRKVDVEVKSE